MQETVRNITYAILFTIGILGITWAFVWGVTTADIRQKDLITKCIESKGNPQIDLRIGFVGCNR